jgi:hypothetical protein
MCACPNTPARADAILSAAWPIGRKIALLTMLDIYRHPWSVRIGYILRARCGCILHFSIHGG